MTQVAYPEALRRCARQDLMPDEALSNQFVFAQSGGPDIPGLTPFPVDKWTLHHGATVAFMPMRDSRDRMFGLCIGVGVDGDGALVTPESFARFNAKAAGFKAAFAAYADQIGGRYVILLDSGAKPRLYFDPMAHLATFYNAATRLAGSSVFLVTDTLGKPNPNCGPACSQGKDAARVFPMGQTPDPHTRLMPGNHRLDLKDFTPSRIWPLRNTIRKVARARSGPVIEQIATRQSAIMGAILQGRDCVMPITPDPGGRMVLAATEGNRQHIAQFYCVEAINDAGTADKAETMAVTLNLPFARHTRDAANRFAQDRQSRRARKRLFWLRTSCAFRVPKEAAANVAGLQWKHHLVLLGDGAEVLTAGWRGDEPAGQKPAKLNAKAEMALVLCSDGADKDVTAALKPDFDTWKASLPRTLQPMLPDFIRMELHRPASAVMFYAMPDNFAVSPFSDRTTIELALKLPDAVRFGPDLTEGIIATVDSRQGTQSDTVVMLAQAS